jgi:hypothetical protein
MPIVIGNPINNTGVTDTPVYQDWMPLPRQINLEKSINIPSTFTPFNEIIQIKDYIGQFPLSTQFRLLIQKSYLPSSASPWIVPFTYELDGVAENSIGVIPITQNGLSLSFPLTTANIDLLPVGLFRFRQVFTLQRRIGFGIWNTLSSISHDTTLKITDDLVFFNPKNNFIDHIIGSDFETIAVTFEGPVWRLVGNEKFTLTSSSPDVYIEDTVTSNGVYQTAFGNGLAVVNITLTEFFDIVGQEPYTYSYDPLPVLVGSQVVNVVAMRVKKVNTQILEVSPNQLLFQAEKNITEALPQNLIFSCNVDYEIQSLPWLTTLVQTIIIDGIPRNVITVTPLSSTNMEAGIYNGIIVISGQVNSESVEIVVNVIYEISDIAQLPFGVNELAFTLDNTFIKFLTFNTDTYMQLSLKVTAFDFYTDIATSYGFLEKIGLFQGRAKVNIGKTIHQILSKDKAITEVVYQYKPATVSIQVDERNLSDNELVRTFSSSNINFIAGLSNNFSKIGFLKFNHQPERVTVKSEKYLNIFVPSGIHKILIYKNNQFLSEDYLLESFGKVMTIKVKFDKYIQGDILEYKITNSAIEGENGSRYVESSNIQFIVFPEGKYSNEIVWEDEFLLKQSIECTGNYKFNSTLEFISQKKYVNLVEHLSHLDVTKATKFSINTGWLMQSDVDTIESLMKSKKVWINANGRTIFMVPVSETITSQDSERELVDYSLEFQINPKYNEETYRL